MLASPSLPNPGPTPPIAAHAPIATAPLRAFAPTLAAHTSLDCGLLRVGSGSWLVFVHGQVQADHPFGTRTEAIDYLGELVRRHDTSRAVDACQAALRG